MGKAKQSAKDERQRLAEEVGALVRKLIKSDAADTVLFGPVMPPRPDETQWSFVVFAGRGSDVHEDAHGLLSQGPDHLSVAIVREEVIIAITNLDRPMLSQLFEDELALVEFGRTIWPDRFSSIHMELNGKRVETPPLVP